MEATLAGVMGAVFGSFLNVVTYRLPRRESIVKPRSRCTGLRGAGEALRQRADPLVAAAAGALSQLRGAESRPATRWWRPARRCCAPARCSTHDTAAGIALSVTLILLLVPAALIDLEHRIIPNKLTGAGALLALGLGTALDPAGEPTRLIAGAAAAAFCWPRRSPTPGGWGWATSSWPA